MKTSFLIFILVVVGFGAEAQQSLRVTESWDPHPSLHPVDPKYQGQPALEVYDLRRIQYLDDTTGTLHLYYTEHKIIHVNDDHGIEYFNKVYIPLQGVDSTLRVQGRAILPGGRVVEVPTENIKETQEENGQTYKIFAVEGLERGSEVEYLYTVERQMSFFGREHLQMKFPIVDSRVEILFPKRQVFETKAYNCSPQVVEDGVGDGVRRIRAQLSDLEGREEEKYSQYRANLARLEYKLSFNQEKSPGKRLFTWDELARKALAVYTQRSSLEESALKAWIQANHWPAAGSDTGKIVAIENFVKTQIAYREDAGEEGNDLVAILRSKIAGPSGIVRLYAGIFQTLQMPFQLVLTSDRSENEIDEKFENWDNCENPLFFFPKPGGFLTPTRMDCRYPLTAPEWSGGNGLFCKEKGSGQERMVSAEIRIIPLEGFSRSFDNQEIQVSLNASMDSLLVSSALLYGGYSAMPYRMGFNAATPDQRKEIFKSIAQQMLHSETILSSVAENLRFEDASFGKPFVIRQKVRCGDLVERAGEKILVKIGLVIGPQVEMYQENARHTPIQMIYPRSENRWIHFKIPAGYRIKNPGDVRLRQVYSEGGRQLFGFVSQYKIQGQQLDIEILEDYRQDSFPQQLYEPFIKVINASSDFNKVVLVLEKIPGPSKASRTSAH